jgi:hypothetical protein
LRAYYHHRLSVDATERTCERTHSISDRDVLRTDIVFKAEDIIKRTVGPSVENAIATSNSVLPVLDVLILPRPLNTVDDPMVRDERWVRWEVVEVRASITTNRIVTSSVYVHAAFGKVSLIRNLKGKDIIVFLDEI